MGRYTSYQKQQGPDRRGEIHPVMRGIGCVLMVIVPFLSYGAASLLVDYGIKKGWPIPPTWLGNPHIYPLLLKAKGLQPVWNYVSSQTNLAANLFFALAIAVVVFGVISIIYGTLFRMIGPPQYGPTDAPPIRKKVKRYKR
jgi:hypothetical protein